jgi:integrase
MTLDDVDRTRRTITVRLKGAPDEHRVPVTDDFWPLLDKYLDAERRASKEMKASHGDLCSVCRNRAVDVFRCTLGMARGGERSPLGRRQSMRSICSRVRRQRVSFS